MSKYIKQQVHPQIYNNPVTDHNTFNRTFNMCSNFFTFAMNYLKKQGMNNVLNLLEFRDGIVTS